ncbi:hypothetical protein QTP81_16605 [Alteromonas sp. ASW11-36]|uniref:Phage abortive infection protein n=1 Tax=Alteromonas arenosi TaxID=3055817 RepID=A0ABT7T396_9ALTE|nr:hypothetical protein [Alteromonas sp. ASW11-36]MDM7862229.1 hypothetical protein [Alteromonas sp. ASW11-36]
MANLSKSKRASNIFSRIANSSVNQLIIWTLFFGVITFILFWLTVHLNLLPSALMSPSLTQESTGLFEALGGWALGFAGALVAIRIAGVASVIQEKDSIREHINLWKADVTHVSELNSRLTLAVMDAKRASASVLLYAKEFVKRDDPNPHLHNTWSSNPKLLTEEEKRASAHELQKREEQLSAQLESKLEILVRTIEEVFTDSVYCSVLESSLGEVPTADNSSLGNKNKVQQNTCKELPMNDFFTNRETRDYVSKVVKEDAEFFDVRQAIKGLNLGIRNFGIGLMELRALPLFEHFKRDLNHITIIQEELMVADKKLFEIADVAWLFLGLLLSRKKTGDQPFDYNDGFVFLALMLGSIPTEQSIKDYLGSQLREIEDDYSKKAREYMEQERLEMAQRLYFLDESDLKEFADLVKKFSDNERCWQVYTRNTGVSSEYVFSEIDSNEAKDRDSGKQEGITATSSPQNSGNISHRGGPSNTRST